MAERFIVFRGRFFPDFANIKVVYKFTVYSLWIYVYCFNVYCDFTRFLTALRPRWNALTIF